MLFHIISQTARLSEEKVTECEMCVLIFLQLYNICDSKKNSARYLLAYLLHGAESFLRS